MVRILLQVHSLLFFPSMNRSLFCRCGRGLLFALLALLCLTSCRSRGADLDLADRLYALWLEEAPGVSDWERALPRTVTVKGGRVHKLNPLPDIDEDTVHVTTASCHHGSTPPAPLAVDLRAFYTDSDLYLRLSWTDPTRDEAMRQWHFDGKEWLASPALEDALGILWDTDDRFRQFTCSYACHIDGFGVAGANFHANNKMKLPRDEGIELDLWNWKAGRTARFGFADDRTISFKGMEGDLPGEIFLENSRARSEGQGGIEVFGPGDAPVYDGEGRSIGKEFRPLGSMAPGYISARPVGSRADVAAVTDYRNGRWIVVLRRALRTPDRRDVVFTPGKMSGVAFGLSIMDDTIKEHYASIATEQLVLLPKQKVAAPE